MKAPIEIAETSPKLPKNKIVLLLAGMIAGFMIAFLIVMAMLNARSGLLHGLPAVVIATLSPIAAWLSARAILGKFRRGCEGANPSFGMARGIDFGAIFGSIIVGLYFTGIALGFPPGVVFLISLPLGSFIGNRIGPALRQWLLSRSKAAPLVAGGVSVWDRELDG